MDSLLPQDNVVGKVKDKAVFDGPDWLAAKTASDSAAAGRVVGKLWKPGKSEILRAKLPGISQGLAVISQPSTTGQNVLAFELAKSVAKELHADCFLGDDLYNALHTTQSKHIARLQRPFNPREYLAVDPDRVSRLLGGKTVIVAEDVLTTGSSVKHFLRALQSDGIQVSAVAALLGDRRLAVDEKTKEALIDALHENGIHLPPEAKHRLALSLTRTEARGIALLANNVRSDDGREKLTRKVQGVLDQGIAPGLGGAPNQGWDQGFQGKDHGHEGAPSGIQAGRIQERPPGPGNQIGAPSASLFSPSANAPGNPPDFPQRNHESVYDSNLLVRRTDMRHVERVAGRLLGTGQGNQDHRPYLLIESTDGTTHCIQQSPEAMKARAMGLSAGNFIELTSKRFVADDGIERVRVRFRSFGNSQVLLTDKNFLTKEVRRIVETTGHLPTEQTGKGWLGDYQRALQSTAQDLIHQGVIRPDGDGRYRFEPSVQVARRDSVPPHPGKDHQLGL